MGYPRCEFSTPLFSFILIAMRLFTTLMIISSIGICQSGEMVRLKSIAVDADNERLYVAVGERVEARGLKVGESAAWETVYVGGSTITDIVFCSEMGSRQLVIAERSGDIAIVDLLNNGTAHPIRMPEPVKKVMFLAGICQQVYLGTRSGSILQYNLFSETVEISYLAPGRKGSMVSFNMDTGGRYIAAGFRDGAVVVWEAENPVPISTFDGDKTPASAVAISPNGELLAIGRADGTVEIYLLSTSQILARKQLTDSSILDMSFTTGGNAVILYSRGSELVAWEREYDRIYRERVKGKRITDMVISLKGDKIFTSTVDGRIDTWDMGNFKSVSTINYR